MIWPHSNKNMNMVRHAIYLQHFVIILLKNAGYILMQSFLPVILYGSRPVFYSKPKLDVNLRVSICHLFYYCLQLKPKTSIVPKGTTLINLSAFSTHEMFLRNKDLLQRK